MNEAEQARFKYWQLRILIAALIGYALYYFVRKNFSIALPELEKDLGFGKKDLGLFITINGLMYGLSKFVNGIFVDRLNARWFFVGGLVISALVNIAFGFSSEAVVFGVLFAANGWVQGMGFPPAARLMTHWFRPQELATKMSIWNVSHSIGAGLVFVLCGYLIHYSNSGTAYSGWKACFFVPAAIALVGAFFLAIAIRDTPQSLGFPEVPGSEIKPQPGGVRESVPSILMKYVFSNPYIWLIAFANFFVYIVRAALIDWGPTYLREVKKLDAHEAGFAVGTVEFAGVFGMVISGWATDRFFGGRGCRTCLVCMIGCTVSLMAFVAVPMGTPVVIEMAILAAAGFFMYGPQALVGIIAANLGTKKAAATAGGFTGIFGYLSSIPAGWGVGTMLQHKTLDWNGIFYGFIAASIIGGLLFLACWKAPPHGYKT